MGELFDRLKARAEKDGAHVQLHAHFGGVQTGYFRVQVNQHNEECRGIITVRAVSGNVHTIGVDEDTVRRWPSTRLTLCLWGRTESRMSRWRGRFAERSMQDM